MNEIDRVEFDSPTARCLGVLAWFSEHPGCTVAELSRATGLAKTSAHRVVSELERLGWLSRAPGRKGPVVGLRTLDMATNALQLRIEDVANTLVLQRLANELGESCTLAVQDGFEIRFVKHVPPQGSVAYVLPMKERAPLYCSSSGRIFLAEWPQAAVDDYLAHTERRTLTPHTIVDVKALHDIVQNSRKEGYASACQQWAANIIGAAVAIRDKRRRCVAALSFNAPDNRVTTADVPKLVPRLQSAAKELEDILHQYPIQT